jgi:hypothetical protein
VDAYFGPDEWRPADDDARDTFPAEALRSRAGALIERLSKVDSGKFTGLERLRHAYLGKQLPAIREDRRVSSGKVLFTGGSVRAASSVMGNNHSRKLPDRACQTVIVL